MTRLVLAAGLPAAPAPPDPPPNAPPGSAGPPLLLVVLLLLLAVLVVGRLVAGWRRRLALRSPRGWATAPLRRRATAHARRQGRVPGAEVAKLLPLPPQAPGIPLGYVPRYGPGPFGLGARFQHRVLHRRPWDGIGLPRPADTGHVGGFGPTRSGKSFAQLDALLRWDGAALVTDPKGEAWDRTAAWRARHVGPVYRLPGPGCDDGSDGAGIDLAACYDFARELDVLALTDALIRPWRDGPQGTIFAEKCAAIFEAAGAASRATGEHPIRVVARWARRGMTPVLTEAARFAPHTVEVFLDADTPDTAAGNRFASGAWGTLTTRLRPVAHYAATLSATGPAAVPPDWAQRRATVYVCYPFQDLEAAAPLVAAVVGGLLRRLMAEDAATRAARGRVLLLLDEAPAVALPGLAGRLATMGGLGITAAVYCQSVSQLVEVYGPHAAETILTNLTHQVYWAPRDPATARRLAEAFGTELEPTVGFSGGGGDTSGWGSAPAGLSASGGHSAQNGWQLGVRERPALDVAAVQALPSGTVAVLTGGKKTLAYDSRTVFGGDRVGAFLATLPPPPAPTPPGALPPPAPAALAQPPLALPAPQTIPAPPTPRTKIAPAASSSSSSPSPPPTPPAPRHAPTPATPAARPRRTGRRRTAPNDVPRPW